MLNASTNSHTANDPPHTSPLNAAGQYLLSLGYAVVPIMPRQKAPGKYLAGRWKAMSGWTRYKSAAPNKFEWSLWANWPDANLGIILGTPAGDGLVVIAVDLDISDPIELAAAVASLPMTPMVKKGAKGLTLFYRASPEFKSRAFNRPDPTGALLANGRVKQDRLADILTGNATKQTVVPPSMHPDGFAYEWDGIGAVPARELPALTGADMERFQVAMSKLGWDPSGSASAPPGIVRAPASSRASVTRQAPAFDNEGDAAADVFRELNRAALLRLSDWVPKLGLFNCRPARGGFEAVATWRPSTQGRPDADRNRNLSVQSSGIKDFGAEQTYSPIDLIMCALGYSLSEAYDWLRMIINPPDHTGGLVLAFDPTAAKTGKRRDTSGQPATDKTGKTREPDMSLLRPERGEPPAFPEDVFSPVWRDWVAAAAEAKGAPVDYVAGALISVASSLIGNARWAAPWEGWSEPPILWVMLVGLPSANKSPALDAVIEPLEKLQRSIHRQILDATRPDDDRDGEVERPGPIQNLTEDNTKEPGDVD